MQFDGLDPFQVGYPTVVVSNADQRYDLHNDADLREVICDLAGDQVRLAWALKAPAWTLPGRPETWQRPTVAGVVLLFAEVRSLAVHGEIFGTTKDSDGTLEFMEYSRLAHGVGTVRLVLQNGAELTIIASRCQLRLVGQA